VKKIEEFIKNLQFLFRPNFWVMGNEYSKEWDELVNLLMEKEEPVFEKINSIDGKIYNVTFANITIWVQNYPYSYGVPSPTASNYHGQRFRPSRLTILKLYNFIEPKKKELELTYSPDEDFKKWLFDLREKNSE
jgi:hypothetical protein